MSKLKTQKYVKIIISALHWRILDEKRIEKKHSIKETK